MFPTSCRESITAINVTLDIDAETGTILNWKKPTQSALNKVFKVKAEKKTSAQPVIEPVNQSGDYKQFSIQGLNVAQITQRLGFKPNIKDDPDKVVNSWGFTVDGERCAVWDYKGSHAVNLFSAFGSLEALKKVFGFAVMER